jgi:hypothetical protein
MSTESGLDYMMLSQSEYDTRKTVRGAVSPPVYITERYIYICNNSGEPIRHDKPDDFIQVVGLEIYPYVSLGIICKSGIYTVDHKITLEVEKDYSNLVMKLPNVDIYTDKVIVHGFRKSTVTYVYDTVGYIDNPIVKRDEQYYIYSLIRSESDNLTPSS